MDSTVTFLILQERLREYVNIRIKNGIYTERGLARILRISQSQTHNVLKGARRLTPELADRMLIKFGITALDLMREEELRGSLRERFGGDAATGVEAVEETVRWRRPAGRSARTLVELGKKAG